MNFTGAVLNVGKNNSNIGKIPIMGPPQRPAPRAKATSVSVRSRKTSSELKWGKSTCSLACNTTNSKTATSSKSTTDDSSKDNIIVALTVGRGEAACEVGISSVNVSRPVVTLCQTSDNQNYANTIRMLNILDPNLIVYPATLDSGNKNRLIIEIQKRFPSRKTVAIPRKSFNKENGLKELYKLCIPSSQPTLIMIKDKYYAIISVSGLLTYLQCNLYIFYASHTIKLEYEASEGYAVLDTATADRLELVSCNQPAQGNKYSSLFGIINKCLTRIGTRNLRAIILQPLSSIQKIEERQDCVEELIENPGILMAIQGVLPKFRSVDQLLSLSTLLPADPQQCSNRQLNFIILLNGILDSIEPLREALKACSQPFFQRFHQILSNEQFEEIQDFIRETIYESAYPATKGQQAEQQRIWAIKPGINGLLDLARKTYSERIEDMREYTKKLAQKYDLPLSLANNNKKGYHITMPLNQNQKRFMKSSDLPSEFFQVFRLANSFTMKTVELVNYSTRIDDILVDLLALSNIMMNKIISQLKQYAWLFNELVEGVSHLDILQSLAEVSNSNGWIRPTFDHYTEIVDGQHPLLNYICPQTPVPNTITACDHYNLHIITGPNGAGKSIFVRQVMLLQIMAQIGCYVPAQSAIMRLADKMYARISHEDDITSNLSSFGLEMCEISYILNTMSDRSLIIIDEICRSTSLDEGTAIAMSICDTLSRSKAFTYVTTHYSRLSFVAELFFNIKLWQMETIPEQNVNRSLRLDFKYKLISGVTVLRDYGIYMVKGIWPNEVVQHVEKFQKEIGNTDDSFRISLIHLGARLKYDFQCQIDKLKRKQKLTHSKINEMISEYNCKMQNAERHGELDFDVNHSIFGSNSVLESEPKNCLSSINQEYCEYMSGDINLLFIPEEQTRFQSQQKSLENIFTLESAYLEPEVELTNSLDITRQALNLTDSLDESQQSSFMNTFVQNLQDDFRKTSTPILELDKNAQKKDVMYVQTPKCQMTLSGNLDDLNIATIVEDLESFIEDVQKEENYNETLKNQSLYPVVEVVSGPEWPSSEEDIQNTNLDEGEFSKPLLRVFNNEKATSNNNFNSEEFEKVESEDDQSDISFNYSLLISESFMNNNNNNDNESNPNEENLCEDVDFTNKIHFKKNCTVEEYKQALEKKWGTKCSQEIHENDNRLELRTDDPLPLNQTNSENYARVASNDSNDTREATVNTSNFSNLNSRIITSSSNDITNNRNTTEKFENKLVKKSVRKKFKPPLKKPESNFLHEDSSLLTNCTIGQFKLSDDYSKWNQKKIRQALYEQNIKFLESSSSSGADLTKLWEDRLRSTRPTPKQLQQATCLATIRKTTAGIQVLLPESEELRPKKPKLMFSCSKSFVNMNIFSDRNAKVFDQFMKSNQKDFRMFNFDFSKPSINDVFNFEQVETTSSDVTKSSHCWTFVRNQDE
ncbi:hypothetical protein ABEB36_009965 [Hypothenemus hampei]|uniref:DNA mismatch repair proteins mutS family domain-containing protein n=1 Tax=Hypothenemus hampei TaxID=57062 RepID=A0ABD1EI66_HYPHA